MKRIIRWIVFLLLALLFVVSVTVHAHPGRTDGSGGHMNHSTGEYHYHHGFSEHQHYDMDGDGIDDCPYDDTYKKNTAKVEKEKEPSNKSNSFTDEYNDLRQQQSESEIDDDVSIDAEQNSSDKKKPTVKEIVGTILVVIIFGPLVLLVPILVIAGICRDVRDLMKKLKKK